MAKLTDLRALLDEAQRARDARAPARAGPASASAERSCERSTPPAGVRPGVHREPPVSSGAVKRRVAATKHAAGDIELARVFADVHRLPPRNRAALARAQPAPLPQQRIEDERAALEMSKYGAEPAPHTWDIGQEIESEQTFVRAGLGNDVLSKLRRGSWAVQAELDLHGHNAEGARDVLADFLLEARGRGLRCVRVIHGKGLTSPNKEPVLKGRVRRWLAQWDDVLAYCEAPRHGGGGGAVLVLLRGVRG